jgi:hypothetical protein
MGLDDRRLGLCATCRHRRTVDGARSTFYMCERSFTDSRYPKYPPLPVVRCPGYEPVPDGPPDPEKHGKLER